MADKKKMSVEEILAACRRIDGQGGAKEESAEESASKSQPAPPAAEAAQAATGETASAKKAAPVPASAPPSGKKRSEMSTADVLAAARAGKAEGAAAPTSEAAQPAGESAGAKSPAKPAGGKPAAAKPAAAKPAGKMSTADILAAARAGKGGEKPAPQAPPAAAPKKVAAEKPAAETKSAKPAAAKPSAAKPAAAAAGPKDTASILAAARASAKPGPISKAEAAARDKGKEKEAVVDKGKKKEVPPVPEKPTYAMPRPRPRAGAEDRRGFIHGVIAAFSGSALAVGFSSLAVTFNLWTLGLARFMFPNILIEPPTRFKVGFPDELAPGQVQTKFVPQFGVWIVRYEYDGQPQIYAIQTVCTHLGCTPNWLEGEQKFKCPCHGSGFYKDGINFEGPAPRPLERFAIRLADDGQLEVDKSRKFKEEMGQWRDPSSFVPV